MYINWMADDGTHYKRDELLSLKDIFTETIIKYEDGFYGDYNTIKTFGRPLGSA